MQETFIEYYNIIFFRTPSDPQNLFIPDYSHPSSAKVKNACNFTSMAT
jgi:hypothetical protein